MSRKVSRNRTTRSRSFFIGDICRRSHSGVSGTTTHSFANDKQGLIEALFASPTKIEWCGSSGVFSVVARNYSIQVEQQSYQRWGIFNFGGRRDVSFVFPPCVCVGLFKVTLMISLRCDVYANSTRKRFQFLTLCTLEPYNPLNQTRSRIVYPVCSVLWICIAQVSDYPACDRIYTPTTTKHVCNNFFAVRVGKAIKILTKL